MKLTYNFISKKQMFKAFTVIGVGLMGGSLLKRILEVYPDVECKCWDISSEVLKEAKFVFKQFSSRLKVVETLEEAVEGTELVLLAVPVDVTELFLEKLLHLGLGKDVLITDVGSVKGHLSHLSALKELSFFGSHPMAGSEKTGVLYASSEIFKNRYCFITPYFFKEEQALEKMKQFWKTLGMQVVLASPEEHDAWVATVSHFPQTISTLMATFIAKQKGDAWKYSGNGLKDSLRLASSSGSMWAPILSNNKENIKKLLEGFKAEIDAFTHLLEKGDKEGIFKYFEQGQAFNEKLIKS